MKKGVYKDLSGMIFNRWTVLSYDGKNKLSGNSMWLCKCACGKISSVVDSGLRFGKSKSCGCYSVEKTKIRNSTHGFSRVGNHKPEYNAWSQMKDRCYNEKSNRFYRYGARGIKVCDRWLNSFENFILDMGLRPSINHSLDRVNNDGDYEKENCRWSTGDEQQRNKSNNRWIEYNGVNMILADWIRRIGIRSGSFHYYKKHNNFTFEETVEYLIKNNIK